MKKRYFLYLTIAAGLCMGSCHSDNAHSGHNHETEQHNHNSEDKDEHDHDGHDHDGHDHDGHDGEIPLPDKEASRLGVRTAKATRNRFAETLLVGGVVERASEGEYIVSAPRSGRFTASKALRLGARISAGQSIGSISSAGMEGGDNVAASKAALTAAEREVERLRPLVATGAVSRAEFQKAEAELAAARAGAGNSVSGAATAPGSGVVTSVAVRSGEYVERGQTLAVISRNTSLTLRADVPARHSGFARNAATANFRQEGMTSAVSLKQNGGQRLGGETTSASEGYIPVRFSFSNNGTAIPGAYAEIWLIGQSRPEVLTIPRNAIVEIQGVKYVFEKIHDGRYAKRRIETGGTDGINVEIVSGLKGGEEIVTEGSRVIRMAEISHIAPPAHSHNH